jgi:hypothetical protein
MSGKRKRENGYEQRAKTQQEDELRRESENETTLAPGPR